VSPPAHRGHRRSVAAALTLLIASLAVFAAPAGARSVMVLDGTKVVWRFHTAKCTRTKHRFSAVFGGEVKNPDYALALTIDEFTGFHEYPVTLGPTSVVFLKLFGPNDAVYSNFYVPPFPAPGFGAVKFGSGGKLLGVGFAPAMFTSDASDAVVLAGGARCVYRKK
jgi:hypothetical protein